MTKKSFSDEDLIKAVQKSECLANVCFYLKLYKCGATYNVLNRHIVRLNLDTSHWKIERKKSKIKKPTKMILVKNSSYLGSTDNLKRRLLKEGLLQYCCAICGIDNWNGQELSLQLDHINGDRYDNRIKNLRLLCPNCHSQTPTYGGKIFKIYNYCVDCGHSIGKRAERCQSCFSKLQPTKIIWPGVNDIIELVKQSSFVEVARKLGVSDNAVRKRIKNHGKDTKCA